MFHMFMLCQTNCWTKCSCSRSCRRCHQIHGKKADTSVPQNIKLLQNYHFDWSPHILMSLFSKTVSTTSNGAVLLLSFCHVLHANGKKENMTTSINKISFFEIFFAVVYLKTEHRWSFVLIEHNGHFKTERDDLKITVPQDAVIHITSLWWM